MAIWIDGYNFIGRGGVPGLSLGSDDKERKLLDLVARYRDRAGVREPILVVFDGDENRFPGGQRTFTHRGIGVEYSVGMNADSLLEKKAAAARKAREITVVSSDRRVRERCRLHGANSISAEEFAARIEAAIAQGRKEKPERMEPGEVEEWLKEFGEEPPVS